MCREDVEPLATIFNGSISDFQDVGVPRIVDDRARSGGPSGVERLTARKPGPRIAQRSVTMVPNQKSSRALSRTHFLERELLLLCRQRNVCIDLVFHRLYGLTGAAEIRVAI